VRLAFPVILSAGLSLWTPLAAQVPRTASVSMLANFGGAVDDPAAELVDVRQVMRTDDGRFVVANGKPLEVRVYRTNGRLEHPLGRVGGGPGEYEGAARLQYWGGDTVAVFSTSGRRWMLFRLGGALVREWSAPAHPGPEQSIVLHGSTIMRTGIPGSRGCAESLLRHWPGAARAPHDAMTDPWGRLWIRSISSAEWNIVDRDGRRVATVSLPRGFWVTQFRGDTLIGLQVDGDGFSHVQAIATRVGAGVGSAGPDCKQSEIPVTPVRSAMLRTTLRNAVTFGAKFHAESDAYPARAEQLPSQLRLDGAESLILAATRDSWVIAIRDQATGYHCLMSIGPQGLPGIVDGVMRCGW
jgi:hypothetical protein